jgi:mannose/fructose/N-acetylgalactosamine-specific phosphotransferase system component IIB
VIALVRVDNRLVHGQVLVTWVPSLGAEAIVVADEEAAASPLARAAMTLALPPGLRARIEPLARVDWAGLAADPQRVLVVVRDVGDLARVASGGLAPGSAPLNLGNVHYARGRRQITPSVFLSGEELAVLERLGAAGFRVAARAVPADAPLGLEEIRRRFAAAPEGR